MTPADLIAELESGLATVRQFIEHPTCDPLAYLDYVDETVKELRAALPAAGQSPDGLICEKCGCLAREPLTETQERRECEDCSATFIREKDSALTRCTACHFMQLKIEAEAKLSAPAGHETPPCDCICHQEITQFRCRCVGCDGFKIAAAVAAPSPPSEVSRLREIEKEMRELAGRVEARVGADVTAQLWAMKAKSWADALAAGIGAITHPDRTRHVGGGRLDRV